MVTEGMNPSHSAHLPRPLTTLVGRVSEIAHIREQLLDPACRLLTLVGAGGMGKTRLAIEVATGLQDQFAAGVYFVNLQPLTDPAQLPTALADGLQVSLSGTDPVESQLHRYLANKEVLLLLDNYEHLLAGVDFLSELFVHAPGLKVLATSREVLNLQEEWLFPLAGLAYPPPNFDPQTIEQYSAATLFIERMRRLRPQIALAGEAAAIGRICQLVEGMPLALELAATWTKSLRCDEIADQIQQNLDFLTSRLRNVPLRHHSMQAVFAYSWALLSAAERETLMRLSVFRSSFSAEAARRIAGASLHMLMSLVDKSLLRWESDGRYRFHELLRQYAEEKLAQAPQSAHEVQEAHCAYFTNFLVQRQPAVHGEGQGEILAEIEMEIDNLRATWVWALRRKLAAAIIGMIGVMPYYYQIRSRYREGATAYEAAVQAFDIDNATPEEKMALLLSLVFLGWLRIRLGEFDAAELALRRCQALYAELDIPPLPGYGTDPETPLSLIYSMRGNLEEALTLIGQAQQCNTQQGHRLNLQLTHYVLCGIKLKQGMYAEARSHAQLAFAMAEAIGDRWFMANCLLEVGQVEEALGDDAAAQHYFQTSYTLRAALADGGGMAVALIHLGQIALRQQRFTQAQELYEQSRTIYAEINDRGGLAAALEGLGIVATTQGEFGTARRHFYEALKLAVQTQLVSLIFSLFMHIGTLFLHAKQEARGFALLTLTRDHPASTPAIRKQAAQQLAHYEVPLPATLDAAVAQWPIEPVETAAALLVELAHYPLDLASSTLFRQETSSPQTPQVEQTLVEPLTGRELEILRLLAQGLTNEEIANELVVAVGTIKAHNHSIFGKLDVNNRTSAVSRARQLQLL
jgi:predicted ATPase/DNA-binding CsgD family transcriptional regulator